MDPPETVSAALTSEYNAQVAGTIWNGNIHLLMDLTERPNPMDEIIPGLWLGDLGAAMSPIALKNRGIKYVVSVFQDQVDITAVRKGVTFA